MSHFFHGFYLCICTVLNSTKVCIIPLLFSKKDNNLINHHSLEWYQLQPDTSGFEQLFNGDVSSTTATLAKVQPRLADALTLLLQTEATFPLMLVKMAEHPASLTMLESILTEANSNKENSCYGGHYTIEEDSIHWQPATTAQDNFATTGGVHIAHWIEAEQLFGCVRQHQGRLELIPGLVHKANGGVLVLSLRTLLLQPQLWLRLKEMITVQRFDWYSPNPHKPIPVTIPPLPLSLRLVLIGERDSLAEFQAMEPQIAQLAIYSECDEELQVSDSDSCQQWLDWVSAAVPGLKNRAISADFWPRLIHEGARYTGDQFYLPLAPAWLIRQYQDACRFIDQSALLTGNALDQALQKRDWQQSALAERVMDDILQQQILIATEGAVIGQINALCVVDFPGHPLPFGEPSRISCVVHTGDGEFTDVERKAELAGNIHAKGMMIMQAWLMTNLELEQQLPFSASLVFEQSYAEVDGDSASLAELCVMISALAEQPVKQNIAVTGAIDQFGHVLQVGGVNEKIESFFTLCAARGLDGTQGVIIPVANQRHLALHQDVVDAVREKQFHIWTIERVTDALPLLTGQVWRDNDDNGLFGTIQQRIEQITQQEKSHLPWPLRWLSKFNRH
ncbi:MAG: Lon protease [Candidatus Erwinia impunctatus]|nr:Lon protease [Culicoides impunctatus]